MVTGRRSCLAPCGALAAARPGLIPRATARIEHLISGFWPAVELYCRMYWDVIAAEIAMSRVSPGDHVLNVGCGASPFTALLLARCSGATVTAVDRDPDAVTRARRLVSRYRLGDVIDVVEGDAICGVPPFDVAVVALQVTPKAGVVRALAGAARPTARIVVREPAQWCSGMYDQLPDTLSPRAVVRHAKGAFERSSLYLAGDVLNALGGGT